MIPCETIKRLNWLKTIKSLIHDVIMETIFQIFLKVFGLWDLFFPSKN